MLPKRPFEGYRCERCRKSFTSPARLQHHKAAEHTLRTLADIRTMRQIPHGAGNAR